MKVVILLFLFITFVFPTAAYAQVDPNRAYEDHVYMMDIYKEKESEYQLARTSYLQHQTLTSKAKAQEATYEMLIARDNAVITYLTALRSKLASAIGVSDPEKQDIATQIDGEVAYMENHKKGFTSNSSLDELINASNDAFSRYSTVETLAYRALTAISLGYNQDLREDTKQIIEILRGEVPQVANQTPDRVTIIERWLSDAQGKLSENEAAELQALKVQEKIKESDKSAKKAQAFNLFERQIVDSRIYLNQAVSFIKEIIKEIERKWTK